MLMLLVLLMLLAPRPLLTFNLEPRHAVVFKDKEDNTLFGYALSFWQETSQDGSLINWLIVGAPKGLAELKYEHEGTGMEEHKRLGAVYKCNVNDVSDCTTLPLLSEEDQLDQLYVSYGDDDGAWLGATIAVQGKPDGALVVCAPRYQYDTESLTTGNTIPGACFYSGSSKPGKFENADGKNASIAQVGISAHFVESNETSELVVGAPGFSESEGWLIVYNKIKHHNNEETPPDFILKNVMNNSSYSYLGYSVTSARFHKDGRVSYISGAPRADGLDLHEGKVVVMDSKNALVSELAGEQVGEYFGASVAAVDLEGDGVHDLLVVGAPLYFQPPEEEDDEWYDQGRVYVFTNKGEARLEKAEVTLVGSSVSGARFGTTIAVIGDLNKDGFTDIAVGAPYEGRGAVYIYLGEKNALRNKFSQRISPEDIQNYPNTPQSGFGISISSGLDVDNNAFPDLAIGSFEAVALVKSYPVVDVEAFLDSSVERLDFNDDKFDVTACLRYRSYTPSEQLSAINAKIFLEVEPTLKRATFITDGVSSETVKKSVTLQKEKQCWPFTVKMNKLSHIYRPIEITMDYELENGEGKRAKRSLRSTFCESCAVVDPQQSTVTAATVPFQVCSQDNPCRTDLAVDVRSSADGKPVVLGLNKSLSLDVSVWHRGDRAYLAWLLVMMPTEGVVLDEVPGGCQQGRRADKVSCSLDDLMGSADEPITIHFEVDISKITSQTKQLIFNITAWSSSEEVTPDDNTKILSIPVERGYDIIIKGNKMKEILKEELNTTNITVNHVYEVVNNGYNTLESVNLDFEVPVLHTHGSAARYFVQLPDVFVKYDNTRSQCTKDTSDLNPYGGKNNAEYVPPKPERRRKGKGIPTDLPSPIYRRRREVSTPTAETQVTNFTDLPSPIYRRRREVSTPTADTQVTNSTDLPSPNYRRRREVSTPTADTQVTNSTERLERALYLNGSDDETVSVKVHCKIGGLDPHKSVNVDLNLHFNTTELARLMDEVGKVVIATKVNATLPEDEFKGNRTLQASVETVVEEKPEKPKPKERKEKKLWQLCFIGIFQALLLLLLLCLILNKMKFFERKTKQKLLRMESMLEKRKYEKKAYELFE